MALIRGKTGLSFKYIHFNVSILSRKNWNINHRSLLKRDRARNFLLFFIFSPSIWRPSKILLTFEKNRNINPCSLLKGIELGNFSFSSYSPSPLHEDHEKCSSPLRNNRKINPWFLLKGFTVGNFSLYFLHLLAYEDHENARYLQILISVPFHPRKTVGNSKVSSQTGKEGQKHSKAQNIFCYGLKMNEIASVLS